MAEPTRQFLHSAYWQNKDKDQDAVIAVIKDIETGESKLEIYPNPQRRIFTTKPALRTDQNVKMLYEHKCNLDEKVVPNVAVREHLQTALYGQTKRFHSLSSLLNSMFVYGSDIDIGVLMKQSFYSKYKAMSPSYRVGGLDIETSVVETKLFGSFMKQDEIIIINYVSPEGKIFCGVLEKFILPEDPNIIPAAIDKAVTSFKANCNDDARKIMESLNIQVTVKVFKHELDLIKWSLSCVHVDKPDYVSIWDINFDITRILNRIRYLGGNEYSIFCHPEVPSMYRVCKYKEDKNENLQSHTHAWHTFEVSGYTQFIDGMCLYSRLRKHEGNEDNYTLDYIMTKHLGTGKKEFDEGTHYDMQTKHKVEYCAYGAIDSLLLVVFEQKVQDVASLHSLLPYSDLASFAQQTSQLKNRFYAYCMERDLVPASQRGKIIEKTDELIVNVGGNVLSPGLAWRTGVNKVREIIRYAKEAISKVIICVNDIDVTSEYPSLMQAMNISKETKILTVLEIEGFLNKDIVDFCGHITMPEENCVYLCNKYLKLPDYTEMSKLFDLAA